MTPIEDENSNGFIQINGVRILYPTEARTLIDAIPKFEYRTLFEALLYSGMRYKECVMLKQHPSWFNGTTIHLTREVIKKKKIRIKDRYVHLTNEGARIINYYLRQSVSLPDYSTWRENLQRWAVKAGLNPEGLGPKTTRKTWESWLVLCYPERTPHIFLSQGHNEMTALKHYVNLPFTGSDREQAMKFVEGWE